jgi:hypothetical protein
MPRFDLKDRLPGVPAKSILHPGGRERIFDLPYDTEDPEDLKLLRRHPLLVESETPAPVLPPDPPALPEAKPTKPSRKEVDDE